jgi:hypothetical protein
LAAMLACGNKYASSKSRPSASATNGFVLIRHPEELPRQLLRLYTQLTQ